jgi:hypothetical protein
MATSISTTDTAKMIRKALKASFPATKFSVRSHSYSGGSSIDISWIDGPMESEVDAISKFYQGASFDGMTDMKDYFNSLIILEGDDLPTEVHFGADFVFTSRKVSSEYKAALIAKFEEISGKKYDDNESYDLAEAGLYAIGSWNMPKMYGCQIVNRMSYIIPAQEKAVA